MSTALVLLNRVRAKAREEQITTFEVGDALTIALLSELNQAVRIVLEERTWNFQHFSDGTQILRLGNVDATGTAVTVTTTLTLTYVATTPETADLNGQFVTSILLSGNPVYGSTTFDLSACRLSGVNNIVGTLPAMPYSTITSTGWMLYAYQYALPSTVRAITEIWHQEKNLEIFQEDEHDFRRMIPRPHESYGAMPEVAFIGGTLSTTVSNTQTPTVADALRIWPIPGTRELLHYRYIKRQADLVLVTDKLDGVPLSVEDLIVQLAYARQLQSIQSDLTRGAAMEARVMGEIERKHRNNAFDPQRHRQLRSLDDLSRGPISQLRRTHDIVPGF